PRAKGLVSAPAGGTRGRSALAGGGAASREDSGLRRALRGGGGSRLRLRQDDLGRDRRLLDLGRGRGSRLLGLPAGPLLLRRLRFAPNVDPATGELRGQTGVLPFLADGQGELVVGHDDLGRGGGLIHPHLF